MNLYDLTDFVESIMASSDPVSYAAEGPYDGAIYDELDDFMWQDYDVDKYKKITRSELTHLVVEEILRRQQSGCLHQRLRETIADILREFNNLFEYMPELFLKPR